VCPQRRPFRLPTKAKLIDACINKFGGQKSNYEGSDMASLIQRLSTYQSDPSYIARTLMMRLISSRRFKPYARKIKIPVDRSTWYPMYEIKEREKEKLDREQMQL